MEVRDDSERRARLSEARLLLIFTPELVRGDPLAALDAALPFVDIVQVRPKPLGDRAEGANAAASVSLARPTFDWTTRVTDLLSNLPRAERPLVFVNDRVDVAVALAGKGVDGVHLGEDDTPPAVARRAMGDRALIGLSTHDTRGLARAWDQPVDLLGFGPVFPTATKGYGAATEQGVLTPGLRAPLPGRATPALVGPERAWVAAEMAPVPVFPIGGIDLANADQLDRVGRAAVGSAVLSAKDPAAAARGLRELLVAGLENR